MVFNRLQNGLINSSIAPWTSKVNCQNIFFSNGITYFFLVILIEIFILKTTIYHKYTLKYQKFTKKKIKKRYYRLCSMFCAKHWRHICAIPHVIICYLFFQLPYYIVTQCILIAFRLVLVICFKS
jgi:hypothetical protein